jgi:hypothetical protein
MDRKELNATLHAATADVMALVDKARECGATDAAATACEMASLAAFAVHEANADDAALRTAIDRLRWARCAISAMEFAIHHATRATEGVAR